MKLGAELETPPIWSLQRRESCGRAHYQTVLSPNFPPIRFARCYRCGRSNLSILVGREKWVKLFGGKTLHGRMPVVLSRMAEKNRCMDADRSLTAKPGAVSPTLQVRASKRIAAHPDACRAAGGDRLSIPGFAKVGGLEKLFGICCKFWLFRRCWSDSLFRGTLQARSLAAALNPRRPITANLFCILSRLCRPCSQAT
jgi:hypothetical protein